MAQSPTDDFTNLLLRRLTDRDRELLDPSVQRVQLESHEVIERVGEAVQHVYFVEEGMLSIVSKMQAGRDVEVGVVGKEGVSGVAVVMGDMKSSLETNVQIAGSAVRISVPLLLEAVNASKTLLNLLLLYARALDLQTASTASANGRAKLEERLARWLLMTHDRIDSDRINITHEFLANMLACRRPGVTVGLHLLEGKGLIRSNRGQIIMLDRAGLEHESNGSYGAAEREYERLMQEDFRQRRVSGGDSKGPSRLSIVNNRAEEA